jgi:hypothetical protein
MNEVNETVEFIGATDTPLGLGTVSFVWWSSEVVAAALRIQDPCSSANEEKRNGFAAKNGNNASDITIIFPLATEKFLQ